MAVLEAAIPSPVQFNVGTGRGASVLEVVRETGCQPGIAPDVEILPRRPDDPPSLVANPSALGHAVAWTARHASLEEIIGSAMAWERR